MRSVACRRCSSSGVDELDGRGRLERELVGLAAALDAQAGGPDQHEVRDPGGLDVGEVRPDPPAERGADHGDALDPELVE